MGKNKIVLRTKKEYFPSILYVSLVFFVPIGITISPCCPDAIFSIVSQMLIGLQEILKASFISFLFQIISLSN